MLQISILCKFKFFNNNKHCRAKIIFGQRTSCLDLKGCFFYNEFFAMTKSWAHLAAHPTWFRSCCSRLPLYGGWAHYYFSCNDHVNITWYVIHPSPSVRLAPFQRQHSAMGRMQWQFRGTRCTTKIITRRELRILLGNLQARLSLRGQCHVYSSIPGGSAWPA